MAEYEVNHFDYKGNTYKFKDASARADIEELQQQTEVAVAVSDTEPTDPNVKLWMYQNPGQKIEIPTMEDFRNLKPATDEQVSAAVSDWLEENISGGETIAVDKSLTVEGAAADAKAVGDLKSAVDEVSQATTATTIDPAPIVTFEAPGAFPIKDMLVNIDAPSGVTGCIINMTGKNLLNQDGTNTDNGYVYNRYISADGTLKTPGYNRWDVLEYVRVKPNTTYTLQGTHPSATNGYVEYNSNKEMVAHGVVTTNPFVFTTGENTSYIRVNSAVYENPNMQLEDGATATSFEPFGVQYFISWPKVGAIQTGVLHPLTGALYANNTVYQIDPINFITRSGMNNIWVDCGDMSVTYDGYLSVISENAVYKNNGFLSFDNKYLNTNASIGTVINTAVFSEVQNWITIVGKCKPGDHFVVSGYGGLGARLWAFLDNDNHLLSSAVPYHSAESEHIVAPANATMLIFSSSTLADYSLGVGETGVSQNAMERALISVPNVVDPGTLIEKPTVAYHNANIHENSNTVRTKFGIFKSGQNMCITYAENVDGTNEDVPDLSTTGKMQYKYKYFHFNGSNESDVTYGIVAKKGSTYIDLDGNSQIMPGGISFGSSVNNRLYFSFAYQNTTINKKDYKPCTCSVTLNDTGVVFGTIYELILVVDGVSGAFNTERIGNWKESYYTSNPPYYDSNGYKWLIPVSAGFAYLTSSDGITWTLVSVCHAPYPTFKEIGMTKVNASFLLFAVRIHNENYNRDGSYTFVGLYDVAKNQIVDQYRINSAYAKPLCVKCGSGESDNLLGITDPTLSHITYYKILYRNGSIIFMKWFEMYRNATLYPAILQDTLATQSPTEIYVVGGNGEISNHTSAFIKLTLGTSLPRDIRSIGFTVV